MGLHSQHSKYVLVSGMQLYASLLQYPENPIAGALAFDADGLHVDVMDGSTVPGRCRHDLILEQLKAIGKPIQVHLMVEDPIDWIQSIAQNTPETIFFHPAWTRSPALTVKTIREYNIKAGIVWNNDNALEMCPDYDEILFMTVEPGACGQSMITERISQIDQIVNTVKVPTWIDGGVNQKTISLLQGMKLTGIIAGSGMNSLVRGGNIGYNMA